MKLRIYFTAIFILIGLCSLPTFASVGANTGSDEARSNLTESNDHDDVDADDGTDDSDTKGKKSALQAKKDEVQMAADGDRTITFVAPNGAPGEMTVGAGNLNNVIGQLQGLGCIKINIVGGR
jgi:hypothetical protein